MAADLLQKAAAWLGDVFHEHVSQLILYRRGTAEVQVRATKEEYGVDTISAYGVVERSASDDWIVKADKLVLPGIGKTTPERGDQIRWQVGSTTYVFEVMPFGSKPDTWAYADPYKKTIRVHSKQTGTE